MLVSESEIVKNAQQRASEILAQAQAESRTLRQTTADYCDNMLKNTEEVMIANASQVKSVRSSLRQPPKNSRKRRAESNMPSPLCPEDGGGFFCAQNALRGKMSRTFYTL